MSWVIKGLPKKSSGVHSRKKEQMHAGLRSEKYVAFGELGVP